MRHVYLILGLLLVSVLVAVAFGTSPGSEVAGPWLRPLEERRWDPFPRSYPTRFGPDISIPAPPQRIVAGSVLTAEVLLSICPPERIAAIHRTAADPRFCAVAAQVRAFGRLTSGDPEDILSRNPDLVLTDSFTRAETQTLLEVAGVTVVRTALFTSLGDLQDNMRAIGYATGLDAEVEELIATMQERLERVADGADQRRDWRLLDLNVASYTSGKGSTLDDILHYVGARNVAADNGVGEYRRLDIEQVLDWDPDALIVAVGLEGEEKERQRILQHPGLAVLRCVKQDRILFVPGALLGSTSHHVAEAARLIAEQLDRWGSR